MTIKVFRLAVASFAFAMFACGSAFASFVICDVTNGDKNPYRAYCPIGEKIECYVLDISDSNEAHDAPAGCTLKLQSTSKVESWTSKEVTVTPSDCPYVTKNVRGYYFSVTLKAAAISAGEWWALDLQDSSRFYKEFEIRPCVRYALTNKGDSSQFALSKNYSLVTKDTSRLDTSVDWVVPPNTEISRNGSILANENGGAVNLIVCDGSSLYVVAADGHPGIEITTGTLSVYGQKECTGLLYSIATGQYAGIGRTKGYENVSGNLVVNGGNVIAYGGTDGGAGIGGAKNAKGFSVSINGGFVTAAGNGAGAGAGIGAGAGGASHGSLDVEDYVRVSAGAKADSLVTLSPASNGDITLSGQKMFKTAVVFEIKYAHGANGSGTIASTSRVMGDNSATILSSSTFTRAGYTQTGWSTTDGGAKAYNLGGSYSKDASVTLYPYWTATATSPSNDNFASAMTISGNSGSKSLSTSAATTQSGEPLLKFRPYATETVWFAWTAGTTGTVQFDTIGSDFDTILGVYTGSSLSTLTIVSENDDISSTDIQSKLTFTCTAGTKYYICAGGYNDKGNLKFNWSLASNCYEITFAPGTYGSGNVFTKTKESGVTLTLPGASFLRNGYTQTGWSPSPSGTTKYYNLGGSYTTDAATTLYPFWTANASTPANDNFASATTISGNSGSISESTVGATTQTGEPLLKFRTYATETVWFVWKPSESGSAQVDTIGSDFDTILGVYTGSSLSSLTIVAENDDISSGSQPQSKCTFSCTAGTTYYICAGGYNENGNLKLNWNIASDFFKVSFAPGSYGNGASFTQTKVKGIAHTLPGSSFSRTGYTQAGWSTSAYGTSKAYDLNGSYATDASITLYPYWTANKYSITYALNSGTPGSDHPTSATYDQEFGVSAPTRSGYTFTGWTVSSGLNTSTAKWGTTTSPSTLIGSSSTKCIGPTVYFKNLTAKSGGSVTLTANWMSTAAPTAPANDNFASATEINVNSGSLSASNVDATLETNEPLKAWKSAVVNTLWWKWTASQNGFAQFDTIDSSFDTVMGIYTGSYLSTLEPAAQNDDYDLGSSARESKCTIRCTAGTTYYICVGGYNDSGSIKLNWSSLPDITHPVAPVPADYDGDGIADVAVFDASGRWFICGSATGWRVEPFGSADCIPVPADYDGDGKADLSVYDTVSGDWWIRYSSGGWKQDNFGANTCIPLPADYDGDGTADLSVYDQRTGDWWIRYSSGGWKQDNFGANTCIPVPADYDGDGIDDLSVYDQQTGDWWIRYSKGLNGQSWKCDNFGASTCDPAPADHDGDGLADLAVYDQRTGDWFIRFSDPNMDPTWTKDNFGAWTCTPLPMDYDGDGRADFAVFDNASKTFWVRFSGGGWTSVGF